MEGADRNRSAHTAGPTAGTLGLPAQEPASQEAAGAAAGQAGPAGGPGTAGRDSRQSRFLATRAGRAMTASPLRRELSALAGFIVAGIAVTWPLATYTAGRLPSTRDTASYVWGFWWMAHQIVHLSS